MNFLWNIVTMYLLIFGVLNFGKFIQGFFLKDDQDVIGNNVVAAFFIGLLVLLDINISDRFQYIASLRREAKIIVSLVVYVGAAASALSFWGSLERLFSARFVEKAMLTKNRDQEDSFAYLKFMKSEPISSSNKQYVIGNRDTFNIFKEIVVQDTIYGSSKNDGFAYVFIKRNLQTVVFETKEEAKSYIDGANDYDAPLYDDVVFLIKIKNGKIISLEEDILDNQLS